MTTSTRLMASFVDAEPVAGEEAILIGERKGKRKQLSFLFFPFFFAVLSESTANEIFKTRLGCRRGRKKSKLIPLHCLLSLFLSLASLRSGLARRWIRPKSRRGPSSPSLSSDGDRNRSSRNGGSAPSVNDDDDDARCRRLYSVFFLSLFSRRPLPPRLLRRRRLRAALPREGGQ